MGSLVSIDICFFLFCLFDTLIVDVSEILYEISKPLDTEIWRQLDELELSNALSLPETRDDEQ
jgi:hypothetical protein